MSLESFYLKIGKRKELEKKKKAREKGKYFPKENICISACVHAYIYT